MMRNPMPSVAATSSEMTIRITASDIDTRRPAKTFGAAAGKTT